MLFKGLGLGLFVVLAAVLMLGTVADDYPEFLEHHYDDPRSSVKGNYCDGMMRRRKMIEHPCKTLNTFIHTLKNDIKAVCGDGGVAYGDRYRRSIKKYKVTTCKINGSPEKRNCEYRGETSSRHIVIACENGLPVHYAEGHIL